MCELVPECAVVYDSCQPCTPLCRDQHVDYEQSTTCPTLTCETGVEEPPGTCEAMNGACAFGLDGPAWTVDLNRFHLGTDGERLLFYGNDATYDEHPQVLSLADGGVQVCGSGTSTAIAWSVGGHYVMNQSVGPLTGPLFTVDICDARNGASAQHEPSLKLMFTRTAVVFQHL